MVRSSLCHFPLAWHGPGSGAMSFLRVGGRDGHGNRNVLLTARILKGILLLPWEPLGFVCLFLGLPLSWPSFQLSAFNFPT